MAEQLGLVTTNPPDFFLQACVSINLTCPALTSGITSGTSFAMRNALEFETTMHPAAAKAGSISAAMLASSAAKITFGAPSGLAGETTILPTRSGIAVFKRQRAASPYARPSERSEAAIHATSNHG